MQKDSTGHVGFLYKGAEISQIVKDSSAARYVLGYVLMLCLLLSRIKLK